MQTDGLKYIKWLSSHRQVYEFSPRIYNIEYKVKYQKTISNEEKLIITVKDKPFKAKNKNVKTLDIPKETKNNESTNN